MEESCCKCVHLSYETKITGEGFDPRRDKKAGIIIHVDYGKRGCECFDLSIRYDEKFQRWLHGKY